MLVIDNYDSFVYNLVQYLGELGADPVVHRHDAVDLEAMVAERPDAVLVSPGPGRPEDAGLSNAVIDHFAAAGVPVLGVCLGHQCIGQLYGGAVVRAPRVMHGKASPVEHDGKGIFRGLPSPFPAARYHSLAALEVPGCFEVTARTADRGELMAVRHRERPLVGVQFHPESYLTPEGGALLRNFLESPAA